MADLESISYSAAYGEGFFQLCKLYFSELGESWGDGTLQRVVEHLISIQRDYKCFINLCSLEGSLVGFIIAQIDEEDNPWCLKPGYGFIRELFVLKDCRRMGYGKRLYVSAEEKLKEYGAEVVYLTADPDNGEPFWETMGFKFTGEIHDKSGNKIYERCIG